MVNNTDVCIYIYIYVERGRDSYVIPQTDLGRVRDEERWAQNKMALLLGQDLVE